MSAEHPYDSNIVRDIFAIWNNPTFSGPFIAIVVVVALFVAVLVLHNCLPIHKYALKTSSFRLPLPKF